MSFISISYVIFFTVVFIIYWRVSPEKRWIVLLVTSYIFYGAWKAKYLLLILLITLITYVAAILIGMVRTQKRRKAILGINIFFCIGILIYFKYFNFLLESFATISTIFGRVQRFSPLNIILPVGISFYTFQAIGYVMDVYKGKVAAEKHLGKYATFVAFFPQLVAGPIERTENLLPQIRTRRQFSYSLAISGLEKILWGAWKKVVIADVLSKYADQVFGNVNGYTGFSVLFAILAFTLQIYCDFSGYSDIAIGSARLLGIELMENFRAPYFSRSLKEFWRRWHISLSQWFRDYLYIPLGGSRKGKLRSSINLLMTFLISGLWHGASINFVVWGGIHGVGQLIENSIRRHIRKNRFITFIRIIITFCFCSIAWVFFRAESLSDTIQMIKLIQIGILTPSTYFANGIQELGINIQQIAMIVLSLIMLGVVDYCLYSGKQIMLIRIKPVKWIIYWALSIWTIICWLNNGSNAFVYFQF